MLIIPYYKIVIFKYFDIIFKFFKKEAERNTAY